MCIFVLLLLKRKVSIRLNLMMTDLLNEEEVEKMFDEVRMKYPVGFVYCSKNEKPEKSKRLKGEELEQQICNDRLRKKKHQKDN